MLGAVGSLQTATAQFTIPRLPSTLTKPSPNKRTHSLEWYKARIQPKTSELIITKAILIIILRHLQLWEYTDVPSQYE